MDAFGHKADKSKVNIGAMLTANDKLFQFDYQNGKYGYIVDGTFYPFNDSTDMNFSYEVTNGLQSKTKIFNKSYNGAYIFMFGGRQNTSNSASETHTGCSVTVLKNYIDNNYGGYGILVKVSNITSGSSVTLNLANAVGGIYGVITW